jgi:hypothetical protein
MGKPKCPNTIHDGMGKVGCSNDMYEVNCLVEPNDGLTWKC